MKKLALILAALILALSLCACNDAKTETPDNGDSLMIAGVFEAPYQYDLTPYIDIAKENYTGIELTKMSAEVTDEEVQEAIDADLSNFGESYEVTDRGAEYGDTLNINFKGFESGVAFDGGTAENYEMVLGQAGFIDGFESQLVGHTTGEEFTIDVVFPEDYSEPLAGKPAQFEIKINSITGKTKVELTDEFVKTNFFCETVEDYRTQKRAELEATKKTEMSNVQKSLAYQLIYEAANIKSIPKDRYDLYAKQITDDISSTAAMYGTTLEAFVEQNGMTMDEFNAYVDEQANAIVEQELVAYSIANAENLLVGITQEDFDAYVEELAAAYGMDAKTFMENYPTDTIWNSLVLEKTINFVIDKSVTK